MRATSNCRPAFAAALVLASTLTAAARAEDSFGDVKPLDTVSPGLLQPRDYPRPWPSTEAGRYELKHFDVRVERESHRVGNLGAYRSIYIFTTHRTRLVTGLRFTYRYEKGDSLAMLDQIYEAADLYGLKRVTDRELVKNLPKDRMLIVVPIGSSLMLDISRLGVAAGGKSIVDPLRITGDGTAANPRVVRVAVQNWEESHLGPAGTKTYGARVGDAIALVMDCQLVVKKIVPADEKHKILGWVEFSPVPAGQEAALRKQLVDDAFSYANVGTDAAFEKALASNHLRKGLLAPRGMRDLIASRRDLERISGPLRLEGRLDRGNLLFLWTFDADFRGDMAEGKRKFRSSLKGTRLGETKWYYGNKYLTDLQKLRFDGDEHDPWTIFGAEHDGNFDFASASPPEQLSGRKDPAYRQHFLWAAVGGWDAELPTLRQLVEACPMLKPPPSEKPFDEFLGGKQIWSFSVSFADAPAAGWSVETAGEIRPELELLLAKQGFKESPRTVHVPLPNDENGTEQHTWQRSSDASSVSVTPRGERIQIDYQTALPPK